MTGKWTSGPWLVSPWLEITSGTDGDGDDIVLAATGRSHHTRGACSVVKGPAQRANAHLIAASPALGESAAEIDRLTLVIESAVRNADPGDHAQVLAALKANRAALSQALGEGQ